MLEVRAPITRESGARFTFSITPHVSDEVNPGGLLPRAVRVNGAGTLTGAAIGDEGVDQTYDVVAGEVLNVEFQYIRAIGTTATGIVGWA